MSGDLYNMSRNQRRRETHSRKKNVVNKSKYNKRGKSNDENFLEYFSFNSIKDRVLKSLDKTTNSIKSM